MSDNNAPTITQLLEQSVLVQGVLAIIAVGGVMYMAAAQIPVPPEVWVVVGSIIGFFFGAKGLQSAQRVANNSMNTTAAMGVDFANNIRLAFAEANTQTINALQKQRDEAVERVLAALEKRDNATPQ